MKRSAFVAGTAATLTAPALAQPAATPLRLSTNPKFIGNFPVLYGLDRGYFRAAGIDLTVIDVSASTAGQIPLLARGDIDMTSAGPVPSLFNQFQQGFNLKLVAATQQAAPPHSPYVDGSMMVVRKDVWDAGKIRKLSDLAGKRVDAATPGSPTHVLGLEALAKARLTPADLTFTTKDFGPANQLAAILNKAVDVQITTEPTATAMQSQGLGVKWLGYREVAPWYQTAYFAVSDQYLREHRDGVVRFLHAYVRSIRELQSGGGKLTPALIAEISKVTEIPADVIAAMGGLAYFGNAAIDLSALRRIQDLWIEQKLVTAAVPVEKIVDTSLLAEAAKIRP